MTWPLIVKAQYYILRFLEIPIVEHLKLTGFRRKVQQNSLFSFFLTQNVSSHHLMQREVLSHFSFISLLVFWLPMAPSPLRSPQVFTCSDGIGVHMFGWLRDFFGPEFFFWSDLDCCQDCLFHLGLFSLSTFFFVINKMVVRPKKKQMKDYYVCVRSGCKCRSRFLTSSDHHIS